MSEGFVKLFDSILESSVWGEPAPTVKVWITMLLKANKKGEVLSTVPGLVRAAALKRPQVEAALLVLLSPDADSRTPDNDGRRIEAIDGGWRILNSQKYRELRTEKQIAEAERKKSWRDKNGPATDEGDVSPMSHDVPVTSAPYADADADADSYAEIKTPTTPREAFDAIASLLRLSPRQLAHWSSILKGMAQGLGTSGMRPATWPQMFEAAQELAAASGDVNVHRYRSFVRKVVERGRPKPPRTSGDKASRGVNALSEWLNQPETVEAEVIDGE